MFSLIINAHSSTLKLSHRLNYSRIKFKRFPNVWIFPIDLIADHRSTSLQSLAERILFSTSENGHISVMFSEAVNALLLLGIRYELAEMLRECFDAFIFVISWKVSCERKELMIIIKLTPSGWAVKNKLLFLFHSHSN